MRMHRHDLSRGLAGRLTAAGVLAAAGFALAACSIDEILHVDDPDVASPGSLTGPAALPVLRGGAFSEFQITYGGNDGAAQTEGWITLSGLLADEFESTETFTDRLDIDKRSIQLTNATMKDNYRDLHRARRAAEVAAEAYAEHDPGAVGQSEVLSLAGYTYVMFGEYFCAGVPYSRQLPSGAAEFGMPTTTDETLDLAIERFEEALAIAVAADADDQANVARVGLGRALLDKGLYAEAAAAVADVPSEFDYVIQYSVNSPRQNNGLYDYVYNEQRWRVPDAEGGQGLSYRSDDDPRVPWEDPDELGFDNESPIFYQAKYPDPADDIVLASGIEARLIEAEAALAAGNYATPGTGTLAILNDLRGDAGIALLPAAVGTAAQVDQLFKERAYWLWLTGHRLGDLRRLVEQYGRGAESVFPSGAYHKGGDSYGTFTSFPIPQDEQNNPNYVGCLDAG
jgi:hypothetical protein